MHLEASPKGYYAKVLNHQSLYRHTLSGRYYAIKKLFGKRRETSLGTTDRKIAERRLKEWIGDLEKIDCEVEKTTVRQLAEKLIDANLGKSKSSQYIVASVSQSFVLAFGPDTQVRKIRPSDCERWLALEEQRLANSSFNRVAGVMKQFFEIAVKDRIIAESPFAKATTRFKKPQAPERHAPTEAQFYALLESVRSQVSRFAADTGDFIQFLGEAGLGQAEAASLTWGQVDWQSNRLRIRRHKTGSWFWVPIYYRLQPLLERLRAEAGTNSTPTSRVFKILDGKKALTAACQRLEFHHFSQRNLRQFHIIRMLKAGVSVKLISKWQGHSDGGKLIWDTYSDVIGADDAQYECQQLDKLKPQTAQYPDFQPDDDGEYERQQLTKLIPKPILPTALQQAPPAANGSHQHTNSLGMENPFKPNEIVTTKVKGAGVTATVVQVFNNEVQVKTLDGKLLWRTMFTVWRVGASPIPKPQKPKVEAVPAPAPAASASAESIAQPDGTPAAENSGGESTGKPTEAEAQPAAAVPAKQSKRRKGRKHRL